jgi:outer membrane protein TolC
VRCLTIAFVLVLSCLCANPAIAGAQGSSRRVTLAQAIDIAAAKSPILEEARDDFRLSQVAVQSARIGGATTVSVVGSVEAYIPGSGALSWSDNLNAFVSQLIFDGGRVLAQVSAAQYGQDAAAGTYKRAAQQLTFSVGQAYYNALEAESTVALSQEIVQQDLHQERLIEAQIAAGVASRLDLATAHAPTLRAELQVIQAKALESSIQATFANVMGLPADSPVLPADVMGDSAIPSDEPLPYEAAVKRALLLRPDYIAAEKGISEAQADIRASKALRSPTIVAAGATGYGVTTTSLSYSSSLASTINLQVQMPIVDGGVSRVQIDQAEINRDLAATTVQQVRNDIEMQVSQALSSLQGARAAESQAETALNQARQLLLDTQELYGAGQTQILELLNAQTTLAQSEGDRLSAIYTLRQAEQNYLFVLGESN